MFFDDLIARPGTFTVALDLSGGDHCVLSEVNVQRPMMAHLKVQ